MKKSLTVLMFLVACTTHQKMPAKKIAPSEGAISSSQLLFRDLFCQFRQEQSKNAECEKELLTVDDAIFADNMPSLEDQTSRLTKFDPESFYQRSLQTGHKRRSVSFASEPITIVLATGLFSEMTSISPFYDILDDSKDSYYKRTAGEKLKKSNLKAEVFSLKDLKSKSVKLNELIKVGSLDVNGKAIVNIVYLQAKLGSFETFGDYKKNKHLYIDRLNKYFSIVGAPNRLYLAGHSRGSILMLDLLAELERKNKKPDWYSKVQGMIAINGAIWGSAYAESMMRDDESNMLSLRKALETAKTLEPKMEVTASINNRNKLISISSDSATGIWESAKKLQMENPPISIPSPSSAWVNWKNFESNLDFSSMYFDYDKYIEKLRLLGTSAYTSIEDLTYQNRRLWFTNNTIPDHITYYSLSSVMASPVTKDQTYDKSPVAMINQPNMGRNTSEYNFLRSCYYQQVDVNKNKLQDGLIGLQDSTFFPSLHMKLNKNQKPYKTQKLGVFATHHTALVHDSLIDISEDSFNPLDRKSLLKAIRAMMDVEQKK